MMQEALRQEMNQLISALERELAEAKVKIIELNGIINSTVNQDKKTINVQTNRIKEISRDSQTTSTDPTDDGTQNCKKLTKSDEATKDERTPRMFIVAGSIGRNLANIISKQTIKYQCHSIIKHGALDTDLLKTALKNTENFTKNDIVIIWTSEVHSYIIDDFELKLKHTNPIILTKPYE